MKKYKNFQEIWKELESDKDFEAEKKILEFTTSLYQLMKERNISKKELAERLHTSQAYITKVFRGNANFTIATMTKLAAALGGDIHIHVTPKEQKVDTWFKVIKGSKERDRAVPEWDNGLTVEDGLQPTELQEVCA